MNRGAAKRARDGRGALACPAGYRTGPAGEEVRPDPRVYSISSQSFIAGSDGALAGIRTVDVERRDGRKSRRRVRGDRPMSTVRATSYSGDSN